MLLVLYLLYVIKQPAVTNPERWYVRGAKRFKQPYILIDISEGVLPKNEVVKISINLFNLLCRFQTFLL